MCTVDAESELDAMLPVTATPSSCWRKSRWNHARRNSPSVMLRMPRLSSLATSAAIAASSTARSSAGVIVPAAAVGAGVHHLGRAQQAADVIGTERRIDSGHAASLADGQDDGTPR